MNQTVIIHGWSDESASFDELGKLIATHAGVAPVDIRLGDWISMNDEVTLFDVAEALERAWLANGLSTAPRSVDVVVHSTGALVVREWMTRFHQPASVPIHRFVMLAPANFGSPLAHKGHSFIGRAVKGWGQPGFQTGLRILKALELASPYTYELAHKDLFDLPTPWYGPGRVLCTVLVGDTGYRGISAIANENGSDGTVRISTANLNAAKMTLHLDEKNKPIGYALKEADASIAFGIVAGANHSTIALKDKSKGATAAAALILGALAVDDAKWSGWVSTLAAQTSGGGASDRFQNTVIRLGDQLGHEVVDYFVEFYRTGDADNAFEQRLYKQFIENVHPFKDNPSYRSMYLDINVLDKFKPDLAKKGKALFVSFLAMPRFEPSPAPNVISLHPAGYRPVGEADTAGLEVDLKNLDKVFAAHRTLLVDARIHRAVDDNVFRMWKRPP